jgi:hypothetical protein
MAERLQAMEQLWDSLRRGEAEPASPEWHEEVLTDRKARVVRGETGFLTMEQLKARLRLQQS